MSAHTMKTQTQIGLGVKKKVKTKGITAQIFKYKFLYLLLLPAVVWTVLFCYLPIYGISVAFVDYNLAKGLSGSTWNNFSYFKQLFGTEMFVNALKNTVVISIYKMFSGFLAPIILAVFLNEIKNVVYQRTIQTVIYLPRFVSWVVYAGLVTVLLSPETGMVNGFIKLFGGNPLYFLGEPRYFRTVLVVTDMLKEAGWGAIIYIAAIAGIDQQLYDAATMDGANKLQKILSITLPSIMNTILVMLILRMGSVLRAGLDQVINLYNPVTLGVGDILDTYVYRIGVENLNFGIATAAGLFQSVIGFLLVLICNAATNKLNDTGIM